MKFFLTSFYLLFFLNMRAQTVVDVNNVENIKGVMYQVAGGRPYVNVKFVELVDGTPFFKENYMKGSVVLTDNKGTAKGLLKLNMLDNELLYLDGKGKEMISTTPIQEITFTDTVSNVSYHLIYSSAFPAVAKAKPGWYLQLTSGKASLFEFFNKQMLEHKPYGSATVQQKIETSEEFYILMNNMLMVVKKVKDIPEILANKKSELETYSKSLNSKSSAEKMTALIEYYNTLQ